MSGMFQWLVGRIHFVVSVRPRQWTFGISVNAYSWPYLTIEILCFDIFIIQRPRRKDEQGNEHFMDALVTWGS